MGRKLASLLAMYWAVEDDVGLNQETLEGGPLRDVCCVSLRTTQGCEKQIRIHLGENCKSYVFFYKLKRQTMVTLHFHFCLLIYSFPVRHHPELFGQFMKDNFRLA